MLLCDFFSCFSKKVWGSKWNERSYFRTRKVKLDHECLSMAVLVQEVINADYAFVIHTTNPSSGDALEIYVEVVKGLGETLVGAYPRHYVTTTTTTIKHFPIIDYMDHFEHVAYGEIT
ncbi:hypothetical protein AHAS_Ahas06G0148900 [Arachis hypogaea]